MSDKRLAGRVAIITGASRGLGQYCAVGYGREGARVVVAARTEELRDPNLPGTIYETAKLVEEAGGEAMPMVCNVGDVASIGAMVEQVLNRYGRIDVLMNNAGIMPPRGISQIEPRHWELEFKINVHGPFHCARAVLPTMIAQKRGSIINISSVAARGGSHYGATKRALEAFSIGLAAEQKDNGIAVNALKPVEAIATPGMAYRGAGTTPVELPADLPSADNYVEAAILLAIQTAETCTGRVLDDAEAVELLKG